MNTDVIECFSKWFDTNAQLLSQSGASVEVSHLSELPQKASSIANIEFDGGELIGIITLQESGECEMEVVNPATGNWILIISA